MKTFLSIGSGPGMGFATAERFAREGFQVVLSARDAEQLPADKSAGEVCVYLINQKLTNATDQALDPITLEDLLEEIAARAAGQQEMYYI